MSKPCVIIAIPTYDGTVFLHTLKAIIRDTTMMMSLGWSFSILEVIGSADIYDARARIVHDFLKTEGTHLMFVDSDVAWEGGGIPRLVQHQVDMVAAVYPRRTEPFSYNLQYMNDGNKLEFDGKGLAQVAGVSAGFMCIRRSALELMTRKYADDPIAGLAERAGGIYPALFDPYRFKDNPTRKLGEDYSFCQRWLDIGGKLYIDVAIGMVHIGQKAYAARLGDHLKAQQPQEAAA